MCTALSLNNVTFLTGDGGILSDTCHAPGLPAFSEPVLDLLDALSHAIRTLAEEERYPDLMTFAFWCRRGRLERLKAERQTEGVRLGRGFTFQITPGNVALNFAFSLAAGLLAGNPCAVRLPSADTPQCQLFCRTLDTLLRGEFLNLRPYAVCFRCDHDSPLVAELSSCCAVRVIWGGDETIRLLRRLPIPPRAVELTFADRYSLSVIDSGAWLASDRQAELAEQFFGDAYWSDQLACTAPRAVLWLGDAVEEAQADFWPRVSALAGARYPMAAVTAVRKWERALLLAAEQPGGLRLCGMDNRAVRCEVETLTPELLRRCPGGGFFLEKTGSLDDLLPALGSGCQTVTSFGVVPERWMDFLTRYRPAGIDRVVAFGHASDFSLTWDGYDLIGMMSRLIPMTL
ncbi:MAG: long-chain-fatty-acyl-CoA reductase [Intestinimonas sp.]|jgi:hypothetical protein|nr:long-chain-fatty-acyl-CoA reductase [Intestinimonas sp.]